MCKVLEFKSVSDAVGSFDDDEKGVAPTETLCGISPRELQLPLPIPIVVVFTAMTFALCHTQTKIRYARPHLREYVENRKVDGA